MNRITLGLYLLACIVSYVCMHFGATWIFDETENRTFIIGFLLTITHGFLVFYAHARASGEAQERFYYWALGIHAARLTIIPMLFLILHVFHMEHLMQFIAIVLIGYFVFLAFEIVGLVLLDRHRGINRT